MNIKKFLIVSCFTLQFSTIIHADQAAWNKAFLAFGGGTDPVVAASYIKPNSQLSPTNALSQAQTLNTPEALAVGHYVSATKKTLFKSTFTDTDVVNAIAAAQTSTSTTTSTSTPSAPVQIGDNVAANWTAAITAFGGSAAISAKTASAMMPASMTSSSVGYGDAQVILQYLNGTAMNATDSANLIAALAANPTVTTTQSSTNTTTQSATDTAAATLKAAIDTSVTLYNSYLATVNQPLVKIAAAA